MIDLVKWKQSQLSQVTDTDVAPMDKCDRLDQRQDVSKPKTFNVVVFVKVALAREAISLPRD